MHQPTRGDVVIVNFVPCLLFQHH